MCPKLKSDAMTKKMVRLVVLSDLMVVLKFCEKKTTPTWCASGPRWCTSGPKWTFSFGLWDSLTYLRT